MNECVRGHRNGYKIPPLASADALWQEARQSKQVSLLQVSHLTSMATFMLPRNVQQVNVRTDNRFPPTTPWLSSPSSRRAGPGLFLLRPCAASSIISHLEHLVGSRSASRHYLGSSIKVPRAPPTRPLLLSLTLDAVYPSFFPSLIASIHGLKNYCSFLPSLTLKYRILKTQYWEGFRWSLRHTQG